MRFEHDPPPESERGNLFLRMSEDTKVPQGSDWTRLLTDPDLVTHLSTLLQTYREVPAGQREMALLKAMREIKEAAVKARETKDGKEAGEADKPNDAKDGEEHKKQAQAQENAAGPQAPPDPPQQLLSPQSIEQAPPFETDLFTPPSESGRRRHHRVKCYVAVEIRVEGETQPVWGNLSNISRGGCLVETASAVPTGKTLEIGLWLASGKIWVKGVIISGVATRSAPSCGVRVKFSESELSEKEHLREFLKFVEASVRKSHSEKSYVAQLKN